MQYKIGVGVVTCNRPEFFKTLWHSLLPLASQIDSVIIVNDGELAVSPDMSLFKNATFHPNITNLGVCKSKNIAFRNLMERECDYIFIIEDDMVIKRPDVFEKYIAVSKAFKLEHVMLGLHGPANRVNGSYTDPKPRLIIEHDNQQLALYKHCVGAFCMYTLDSLRKVGILNEELSSNCWEHVYHTYALIKAGLCTPYWWFPDIGESQEYIGEQACSEDSSSIRRKESWMNDLHTGMEIFKKEYGVYPFGLQGVADTQQHLVVKFLQELNKV